jgi:60 kDa SS-A/Ro ribonucleoprotein
MIFPFRFWAAYQRCQAAGLPESILAALRMATELATANCPELPGATLVSNDVSGSMWYTKISEKSDLTPADVASILGAAAYKRSGPGSEIVSFSDQPHPHKVHVTWPLMDIARTIAVQGGGTDLSQPILWALAAQKKFDNLVFITDDQDWCAWLRDRTGAIDAIRNYKRLMNPKARFFFLQVMPYQHAVVPPEEPNCHYLYGWSDEVLRYIGLEANDGSQVDTAEEIVL